MPVANEYRLFTFQYTYKITTKINFYETINKITIS